MTDFEWAIGINRLMLKIVGLWPQNSQDSRPITGAKLRRLCSLVMLLFILTIPNIISLLKVWGDMVLMINNLQYTLPWMITVLKVCIIWRKQEVLALLIDMIERDWMKVKMKDERDVMLRRARIARVLAICGLITVFVSVLIIIGFPCLKLAVRYASNMSESEKVLPVEASYLHDTSGSPEFELMLAAQTLATFAGGFSYSGVDNLMGLLILHICGQLENLHSRLTSIKKYPNFDAVLRYSIEDHIRLIRSIEIVDDTFHLMLLGIVLYFTIIFCLQGFLIVNVLNEKSEVPVVQMSWFIVATITSMLHMCLYCVVGELLVTQSEKIHHAAYEYAWYTMEPKATRNLIIIMLRANKPLYITAGKVLPMTMATFCNLLKTSAGYISVLLANQD